MEGGRRHEGRTEGEGAKKEIGRECRGRERGRKGRRGKE